MYAEQYGREPSDDLVDTVDAAQLRADAVELLNVAEARLRYLECY
jgi:hypothetical protein